MAARAIRNAPNVLVPPSMRRPSAAPKVGVLIVAYNAEKTIRDVLSRIKPATWERIAEVFIFDDCSSDKTAGVASQLRNASDGGKVKIFRNEVNLGYGGNQKRGYRYAILNGFDIVVLLHGDGQYAPEAMDSLIDPIAAGEADAVFGSRMLISGAARKGGMPLYKYVGNKLLTWCQNRLLGAGLSEYHSGYRAYSVRAIASLPVVKNSNDFHFDNEIIIQFHAAGLRIREVPIPTYYGDEICYVNGVRYAWNIARANLRYVAHRMGLLYSPQFDVRSGTRYVEKRNAFSSHRQIVSLIDALGGGRALDILDLGCGSGGLARHLADRGHRVVGIDYHDSAEARRVCQEFHVADLDGELVVGPERQFDVIILADVVEHVADPEGLMMRALRRLRPEGRIVASTGNVAHAFIRLSLLLGRFAYAERGILDRTHRRLFTLSSFAGLLEECGWRKEKRRVTPVPFENIIPGWPRLTDTLALLNMLLAWVWPGMFAYQVIVQAKPDHRATELLRYHEIHEKTYEEYVPSPPDLSAQASTG
ncbi:MAG: glycosyltransferase [Candidatus Lambdaproteobacteria bacterium]|nr:glycosyltransferase [Candidatus Lambdaproteobacteria bacterium]